jgi:hypothetical protein
LATWAEATILVIDGYEQLGWYHRWRLKRLCRRGKVGLLVTAHKSVGLPPLLELQPTSVLMRQLVRHLWPEHDRLITDREIDACFESQRGNVREAMFALYDLFESRIRR